MRQQHYLTFLVTIVLVLLVACQVQVESQSKQLATPAFTPVTIKNCGVTNTYKQPPKRVITLNQPATEIMLALGLEANMVGTAYLDDRILPEYQQAYAKVPVIAQKYPSKEVLLASEPDFIYASFPGAFGENATSGRQDLLNLGINSYLAEGAIEVCKSKQGLLENIYNEIRDIGRIFGVNARAEKLITSLQQQLQDTQSKLGNINKNIQVFWYADESPPYTITVDSLPNLILERAGGRNIFQQKGNGTYIKVNWEDVVNRDPEIIILSEAFWSPANKQRQFFLSNPAYSKITAVKKDKFIVIDYSYSTSGVRIASAVRKIAEALYPERFR